MIYAIDVAPPVVSAVTLTSTASNPQIARASAQLTLQFTVTDDLGIIGGSVPPASFAVTVGPAGSAAPVFATISGATSTSATYRYTWSVPAFPAFTSVGYSITVGDSAGNMAAAVTAANVVAIGKCCVVQLRHIDH